MRGQQTEGVLMLITTSHDSIAARAIAALRANERRATQRVSVRLETRFMLPDRSEHTCETSNVSAGGAEFGGCNLPVELGQELVCNVRHLGWFDAVVTRVFDGGFAVRFDASNGGLTRLLSRVEWLGRRESDGTAEQRAAERIVPTRREIAVRVEGDDPVRGTIVDVSRTGVAVNCSVRLEIGRPVVVGRRRATVVREFDGGFAAEFSLPIGEAAFSESVVL